ncbi:hypothetical protein Cph01nite_18470 [Cellulomonas phragmiteti]|uniref:Fibronectin type-III domain-containing protein n=1 Tax=Cellulomonas phragmiteti TaxID=478780 RepID=A0ABQ4DL59_9CELL|nr:hypothetical protein Cph01nite_18470 [Cellulomonas phragmiteti]
MTGAALVLGAALGSGVASTVVTMSDGVTWLPDDETGQVVQINPGTGRAERRLQVAGPGSDLAISQRDGRLVVTDGRTGTMTSIDLATLMAGGQRRSDEPARVLVGGGLVYLVTPSTGVVRAVDPLTLQDLGTPHRMATPLADAVVDARGAVWVVTTSGELRSVTWLPEEERFEAGQPRPVRGAGAGTRLLPHERGVTVFAPDGGAVLQVGVGRDLAVAVPDLSGEVLPAATAPTDLAPAGVPGRSAVVMLAGDRILDVGVGALGCERPGRPAVFAGLVYVPCTGAGRVVVLRPDGTRARPDVTVPGGRDPRLLVDDGRLVVHTEDGSRAVVVESDGTTRVVDTGRAGAAVHDPRDAGSAPVAAPPPPQRPDAPVPPPGAPQAPWSGGSPPDPTEPVGPVVPPVAVPPVGAPPVVDPTVDPTVPDPERTDAPRPGTPGAPVTPGTPGETPTGTAPTPGVRPTTTPTPSASPAPAPVAPTGVAAALGEQQTDGLTDVTVTWRASSPRPDAYVVRASVAGLAPVEVGGGTTSAVVRGVDCNTRLTFTVEAVDGGVASAPASSPSVRTGSCVGPLPVASAPTGVTAAAHPDGTVTVSWTAPSSGADSYLVGPVGGSTTTTDGTATSLVLRDVPPGAGVRFVVQAVLGATSAASQPSAAVTVAGVPGAVTALEAFDITTAGERHYLSMRWGAAPDNGSPVSEYVVAYSGGGVSGRFTTGAQSQLVEFSCAGTPLCAQGGTLTVTVTARNGVGEGPGASYGYQVGAYVRPPAEGESVVSWVTYRSPGLNDQEIPAVAQLAPPSWWAEHAGGCTLVVSADRTTTQPIACSATEVYLGSFHGGTTVTVSVRAENVGGRSVTSAAVSERMPNRNEFAYCDLMTRICTDPVSLPGDRDVVVVPIPWVPRLPHGPERPPLAATGVGLLLAAGALHAARRRSTEGAATATPTVPSPTAPEEPAA